MHSYAPAYERFGSKISAIHFIGPNKPWASITYRAPGTKYGQSSNTSLDSKARAYDYDSLVDRWFDVYDRNYRSEESPEQANFQFTRYDSVWDSASSFGFGAEMGHQLLRLLPVVRSAWTTYARSLSRVSIATTCPAKNRSSDQKWASTGQCLWTVA